MLSGTIMQKHILYNGLKSIYVFTDKNIQARFKILLAKRGVAICPQSEWKKVRVQYVEKKYLFLQKEAQNNKSSLIETNCIAIAMTYPW